MNKCHQTITWHNDTVPAINESNLNQYDGELNTLDNRIITLDTSKANQSDLLTCLSNVTYNTTTGVFVFTWKNGSTTSFDLNVEKIPVSFSMSPQGVITMKTADGTEYTCDVSSLIKTYNFNNSSTIGITVTNTGNTFSVVANVLDGSITNAKLNSEVMSTIQGYNNSAATSALKSEGYAIGKQNGTAVESGSPYYHNNSEYFSGQSNNQRKESEAWAVGTKDGTAVTQEDSQYNNNSKYYAEKVEEVVEGLISSLGLSVKGTTLIFSASFEASYTLTVVGTQLQISQVT